jgi:hypothetical protein
MSEGGPISRAGEEPRPLPGPVQSEAEAKKQEAEVPSSFNPMVITGAKCILCQSPVEIKLPVRLYLEHRMIGEVVMLCTNPECRAIGTAGFDIKRCDFVQPKKGPVPMED